MGFTADWPEFKERPLLRKVSRGSPKARSNHERIRKIPGGRRTDNGRYWSVALVWYRQELARALAGRYSLHERQFQFPFPDYHLLAHQSLADGHALALSKVGKQVSDLEPRHSDFFRISAFGIRYSRGGYHPRMTGDNPPTAIESDVCEIRTDDGERNSLAGRGRSG